MIHSDFKAFAEAIVGVHQHYRQPAPPEFSMRIWWESLAAYPLETVQRALVAHINTPDRDANFVPSVGRIKTLIDGSVADNATAAWTMVETAIRHVGTGTSVVFDDPLIHAVVVEIGGWITLGKKPTDELPFVARDFQARYRAHKGRGVFPTYPPKLIGYYEAENALAHHATDPPVLIGDPVKAMRVMQGGVTQPRIAVTPAPAIAQLVEA